jgi:hypothetical protein
MPADSIWQRNHLLRAITSLEEKIATEGSSYYFQSQLFDMERRLKEVELDCYKEAMGITEAPPVTITAPVIAQEPVVPIHKPDPIESIIKPTITTFGVVGQRALEL